MMRRGMRGLLYLVGLGICFCVFCVHGGLVVDRRGGGGGGGGWTGGKVDIWVVKRLLLDGWELNPM